MAVRTCMLFAAWASCEGATVSASCDAGRCEEQEETDLLQRTRSHGGKLRPVPRQVHRALASEGGGWKAQSVQVGLLSGLLHALGDQCPCTGNQCCLATSASNGKTFPCPSADAGWNKCEGPAPTVTFATSGLLANFDTYSSNSGGSWFTSSLVYSKSFMEMLEQMAANPMTAGDMYNELYTGALLPAAYQAQLSNPFPRVPPYLPAQVAASSDWNETPSDAAKPGSKCNNPIKMGTLHAVMSFGGDPDGDVHWPSIIYRLLDRTAGIGSLSLGDAVNEFAKGKTWLAGTSLPTGGADLSWAQYPESHVYLQASSVRQRSLSYQAQLSNSSAEFPPYLPAKFTVQLGGGRAARAPRPFCADAKCFNMSYTYTMKGPGKSTTAASPPLGDTYETAFGAAAGKLPVYQVAAASSAFQGAAVYAEIGGFGTDCLILAVPACGAPDGKAFEVAQEFAMPNLDAAYSKSDEDKFSKVAKNLVTPLVDGGVTDNTAVSWAVAGGATEVVVILQWYDLINLFAPSNTMYGPGSSLPDGGVPEQQHIGVFQEAASDVQDQFEGKPSATGPAFLSLEIPEGNKTYLDGLVFGTISATTVDSPWYGIKAGVSVTIHAFWPNISLGIAGPLHQYGVAIGEIVQTMVHEPNRDKVKQMLSLVMRGTS